MYARAALAYWFDHSSTTNVPELPALTFQRVNVTLRVGGVVRGSMSGSLSPLPQSLRDAVFRAAMDTRFDGPVTRCELRNATIEVWLQLDRQFIPQAERGWSNALELGKHGVEISCNGRGAYYKPSVALTSHIETPQKLFGAVSKKAGLEPCTWLREDCQLWRTSWLHYCEVAPNSSAVQLAGLRVLEQGQIEHNAMKTWIEEGLGYFACNQLANGSFAYFYDPLTGKISKDPVNPVRASGCAYAASIGVSLLDGDTKSRYLPMAKLAIEAVMRRLHRTDGVVFVQDSEVMERETSKLGTTALLALALTTEVFRDQNVSVRKEILQGMAALQRSDGGFNCRYGNHERSRGNDENFFPGQALLAFVSEAEAGNREWLGVVGKAFPYYRDYFERCPTTAFVGWHIDVWSRAAILEQRSDYEDFVYKQINWLLKHQLIGKVTDERRGGFCKADGEPNFSTIVYTEALARGAYLAFVGNNVQFAVYRDAFRSGLGFCSRLRLSREQGAFFASRERAVGGVTTSLTDFRVRSDFVQHLVTLAATAYSFPMLF